MKKVFLTRKIPKDPLEELQKICDLEFNKLDRNLTQDEIIKQAKDCDVLFCLLSDKIDKRVIDALPNLKGIVNYAVGYNNIDIEYATEKNIAVTNTPGVLTETTADLAWALIFSIARRVVEADKFTRSGKFVGWAPELLLGGDIFGKTLGIIGAGRIGKAVARRASGFGMKVLYTSRSSKISQENCERVELDFLLENSDFVSLHVPLTNETKHLITKHEFEIMKPTAYLINTARGAVVKESDLLEALRTKQIAGAGLDVYEKEPRLIEGLTELSNVVLLPHVGSGTLETRSAMGFICVRNIKAILDGELPPDLVNKDLKAD